MKEIEGEESSAKGDRPVTGQTSNDERLGRCGVGAMRRDSVCRLRRDEPTRSIVVCRDDFDDALPRGTHRVIRDTDNSPRVAFLSIIRTRDFVHTRLFTFFFFFFFLSFFPTASFPPSSFLSFFLLKLPSNATGPARPSKPYAFFTYGKRNNVVNAVLLVSPPFYIPPGIREFFSSACKRFKRWLANAAGF